jgi:hypothetical protein
MAHFAKLDNLSTVVFVTVGRDDEDELDLCARTGDTYRKTSYNTHGGVHLLGGVPFRKNFAGIGFKYDEQRDAFIPPKPYSSWILDEESCLWKAPIEKPEGNYVWNENILNWEVIENG